MSDPAEKQLYPAQPALTSARPKVLRRPAALTRTEESAEIIPLPEVKIDYIPLLPPQPLPTAAAPATPWQEDARFGITLLATIVLVNMLAALLLGTPAMPPRSEHATLPPDVPRTAAKTNVLDHKAR